ncbi:hypothetical protein E2C01_037080 [Portunus trituberculatus]|uniref:Uncharacterized protein n=1 Tax=Portunus trituberculatus TaxID=210409 RepID=A0A5B7FAG0_PORTR|nr:hypothetical protein [Portunus trituberculatus]
MHQDVTTPTTTTTFIISTQTYCLGHQHLNLQQPLTNASAKDAPHTKSRILQSHHAPKNNHKHILAIVIFSTTIYYHHYTGYLNII